MIGLGALYETSVSPVRGIFSDDGERFFVWDKPTKAFLSPTIDDIYHRVLFQNEDGFRVTQANQMLQRALTPGEPLSSWKIGVKAPVSLVASSGTADSWAGDSGASLAINILCKTGSTTTKTTAATLISTEAEWKSYIVTVPDGTCSGSTSSTGDALSEYGYGFVKVPTSASGDLSWAVDDGGFVWHTASGTVALLANSWYLDQYGNVITSTRGPFQSYSDDVLTYDDINGRYVATTITYNGVVWEPTELFLALTSGTTGSTGSSTSGSIAFEIVISNPTSGVTYLDQEVNGEAIGGGSYRVVVPQSSTDAETIAYVAVAVNIWGEESANVSPVQVNKTDGGAIVLTATLDADADQVPIAGVNFYRTYASNQSSDYILINTSPVTTPGSGTFVFTDATISPPTTTILKSSGWDEPPVGLENLTYVGNGFFAASLGKDLLFSEPYHPHAWPYRMTLPHNVAGIVQIENGILVTTASQPYLVMGAHPAELTQQLLPVDQAGVSGESITRIGSAAVYVSNDGLVDTFGGQPSVQSSQGLFTRQDWRSIYRKSFLKMVLASHDGRVVGIVPPDIDVDSFLLDLDENGSFCALEVGDAYTGATVPVADALYLGFENGIAEFAPSDLGDRRLDNFVDVNGGILALNAGGALLSIATVEKNVVPIDPLAMVWHSGEFLYPRPVAFGAAMIDCSGNVTVEVFGDLDLIHTQVCTTTTFFRLPPVSAKERWSVRLSGTATVRQVALGSSFMELRDA